MWLHAAHESSEGSSSTTSPKPTGEAIPVPAQAHLHYGLLKLPSPRGRPEYLGETLAR